MEYADNVNKKIKNKRRPFPKRKGFFMFCYIYCLQQRKKVRRKNEDNVWSDENRAVFRYMYAPVLLWYSFFKRKNKYAK